MSFVAICAALNLKTVALGPIISQYMAEARQIIRYAASTQTVNKSRARLDILARVIGFASHTPKELMQLRGVLESEALDRRSNRLQLVANVVCCNCWRCLLRVNLTGLTVGSASDGRNSSCCPLYNDLSACCCNSSGQPAPPLTHPSTLRGWRNSDRPAHHPVGESVQTFSKPQTPLNGCVNLRSNCLTSSRCIFKLYVSENCPLLVLWRRSCSSLIWYIGSAVCATPLLD